MIAACAVDDLPVGESARVADEVAIAVFNAIDLRCLPAKKAVRTYPVVVQDGVVYVDTRAREAVA